MGHSQFVRWLGEWLKSQRMIPQLSPKDSELDRWRFGEVVGAEAVAELAREVTAKVGPYFHSSRRFQVPIGRSCGFALGLFRQVVSMPPPLTHSLRHRECLHQGHHQPPLTKSSRRWQISRDISHLAFLQYAATLKDW